MKRRPSLSAGFLSSALLLGCGGDVEPSGATMLRQRFPEHAARVLEVGHGLTLGDAGFVRARPEGLGLGDDLRIVLPRRGSEPLRLRGAGELDARVREVGAQGEGEIVERAVAYPRAGGSSFWSTIEGGYEEWLLLERGAATHDRVAAAWEVEGARLEQDGEAVAVLDAAGVPRVRVTAPVAYAGGGREVAASLTVEGARIELRVDAEGEEVLVDPQWISTGNMPYPWYDPTLTISPSGDGAMVIGGYGNSQICAQNGTLSWAAQTGTWSVGPWLSQGRTSHTVTRYPNGTILVVGGDHGCSFGGPIDTVEFLTPGAGSWGFKAPLPLHLLKHSATLLPSGNLLVVGGCGDSNCINTGGGVLIYDIAANTWTFVKSIPFGRIGHTATLLQDGRVLVAGGYNNQNGPAYLKNAEIYDPALDQWTPAGAMLAGRMDHFAALLPDGKVVVGSGYDGSLPSPACYLSSTEIYDPATNAWTAGPPMNNSRYNSASVQLADGKVLVTSGTDFNLSASTRSLATCELYDPAANAWFMTAPLSQFRREHGATRLSDGRVLVVGGFIGPFGAATPTAEIYGPSAPAATGSPCAFASECQSGFCADGVCCNTACNAGPCDACSVALGASANGTCALLTGNPCDDGSKCTQADTCQNGVCVGGNPVVCTPSGQCHDAGTCDPMTGTCSNPAKADGSTCKSSNLCAQNATCQSGACIAGPAVVCAAQDQCHTAGTCAPATGVCSNPAKPNGSACSDGDPCTTGDACQTGVCQGGAPVVCAPLDQCHVAGTCDSATGKCSTPTLPDGTACDDGDACTQSDSCQSGICTGSSPVVCTAMDQCHAAGTCNPQTGQCSTPPVPDGSVCDDGNACTKVDRCQSGICTGQNPVTCAAVDSCHAPGACDPQAGTCSTPMKPDGSACPGGACESGVCVPGSSSSSSSSGGTSSSSSSSSSSSGGTSSTSSSGSGDNSSSSSGSGGGGNGTGGSPTSGEAGGCGCGTSGAPAGGAMWMALGIALVARRRRYPLP